MRIVPAVFSVWAWTRKWIVPLSEFAAYIVNFRRSRPTERLLPEPLGSPVKKDKDGSKPLKPLV